MSQAKLILSQSPPPWVPLRFFVTAPVFAVATALLLLWQGEISFTTRWSPSILAATHLLVLGFMAMVMTGALIQVVSVLVGGTIPAVKVASGIIHITLLLGSSCLAIGFIGGNGAIMGTAVFLLGAAFLLFALLLTRGILSGTARRDSGIGIGIALMSLSITVLLGLWLASGYAWEGIPVMRSLTDTHLAWGIWGWVAILVITVAYIVVPMFQLTPPYPEKITPWLAPAMLLALIIWSSHNLEAHFDIQLLGAFTIAAVVTLFAIVTLRLQFRRKKKQPDAVVWFWHSAMISLLAAVALWLYSLTDQELLSDPRGQLLLGTLVIIGFAISTINGMLYKIIPFLIWLHLSIKVTELKLSRRLIPNIKTMIPDNRARVQFWLHLLALLLLLSAAVNPGLFLTPACIIFAISNLLLLGNLIQALQLYSKTENDIDTAGEPC